MVAGANCAADGESVAVRAAVIARIRRSRVLSRQQNASYHCNDFSRRAGSRRPWFGNESNRRAGYCYCLRTATGRVVAEGLLPKIRILAGVRVGLYRNRPARPNTKSTKRVPAPRVQKQ